MKTQYLCFPIGMKPTNPTTTSATSGRAGGTPSSLSLLDRFREAVFRLMMATALSKASNNNNNNNNNSSKSSNRHEFRNSSNVGQESVRRSCYLYDPYHNEALADCIEFIKKKSATSSPSDHFGLHDDHDIDDLQTTRNSNASVHDVIIPLPVM